MSPTASNEEIIEKKPSAPVATACLIISAVALIGAITLQLMELGEYRTGIAASDKDPAATRVNAALKKLKDEVSTVLEKTAGAGADAGAAAPETKAGGAEATEPAGDSAATPAADSKASDTKAGDAAAEPAPA